MTYSIVWSEFSESQLDKIFEYYTDEAGYKVAKKLVTEIITETNVLKNNPLLGQIEDLLVDRIENYHYLVCGNYKIIYSIDNKRKLVKIADIFDTRQNPIKIKRKK